MAVAEKEPPESPRPPGRSEKRPVVALVGNPNTGKTSVFNSLCGTRQKTGNYSGVTVERKIGISKEGSSEAEILDLPGLYSLKAVSPDEEVALDVLMGRLSGPSGSLIVDRPDLVLFVLDGTNLKRNLYLYSQVAELGIPVVVAMTMADVLEKERITIDTDKLSKMLNAPVVLMHGRDKESVERLRQQIHKKLAEESAGPQLNLGFDQRLDESAKKLAQELSRNDGQFPVSIFEAREAIFSRNHPHTKHLFEAGMRTDGASLVERYRSELKEQIVLNPSGPSVTRYKWIRSVVDACEVRPATVVNKLTSRLDSVFTHRVFGLFAFTGIMYLIFQSIYSWAEPFMGLIEDLFGWLGATASVYLTGNPMLQSLVVDGMINGVGSVVVFLPQILILFLFVAFLEDSGYLARAAFLMDRLLGWSGLNGRAFIPMLSSFACAIPGVMAARVMPDARARLTTILVAPLMSCSARLPVYILLIGAFIEPVYGAGIAALTLFLMHGVGLLVSLPVAFILNRGFLKTPQTPFVMELPPYRMPQLYDVFYRAYEAGKKFITRAGTIIFALSIIIWALSYFPRPDSIREQITTQYEQQMENAESEQAEQQLATTRDNAIDSAYLEQSYLGRFGKFIEPVFRPLGFDWKISVGIVGAFPAREVIISTLGIIYSTGADSDEESADLRDVMKAERHDDGSPVYTPLVAITLMVFFALCSQCMSTLATVQKELGSTKWAVFLFVYMTTLAYVLGLAVYQIGSLFTG